MESLGSEKEISLPKSSSDKSKKKWGAVIDSSGTTMYPFKSTTTPDGTVIQPKHQLYRAGAAAQASRQALAGAHPAPHCVQLAQRLPLGSPQPLLNSAGLRVASQETNLRGTFCPVP